MHGRQRDGRTQRHDGVDARILLQFGSDGGFHRRHVRTVDVEVLHLTAAKAGSDTGAAGFECDVPLVLNDADDFLGTVRSQSLAGGFARDLLVLAEVSNGSLRLPGINSALNATTGMPSLLALSTAEASASGRASDTAMPLTSLSTAVCDEGGLFRA